MKQPIPRLPDLRDPSLKGSWLNYRTPTLGEDYGPLGYDMTPVGNPRTEGPGVKLVAASDQYLRRAEADWQPDAQGTISAWVKLDSVGEYRVIFSSADEASLTYALVLMVFNDNRVVIGSRVGGGWAYMYSVATLEANQWYHIVATCDGASKVIYIDGTSQAWTGSDDGIWLDDILNRDNVTIGVRYADTSAIQPFDGEIRNVDYYNRALSANEVKFIFLRGVPDPTLVGEWSGSVDQSRFGLDLTPINDAIIGRRIVLDGVDQYLGESVTDWRGDDVAGTVMGWVKRNVINAFHCIVSSADEGTNNYHWNVHIGDAPRVNALAVQVVENGVTLSYIRGGTSILAGRWYHIAVVSDGNSFALYVDGIPEALTILGGADDGSWIGDVTLRDNLTIGARSQVASSIFFSGEIDEVKVYSEAKSAAFIKTHYQRTEKLY